MTNENNKKPGDTTPDPPLQSKTSDSLKEKKELEKFKEQNKSEITKKIEEEKKKLEQLKEQAENAKKTQTGKIARMSERSSTLQFLMGFLKLILQLIIGGCITSIFVLISWGCEQLAIKFVTASPISAIAYRIIGVCIFGAGVVSIVIFTYATTRDFARSILRRNVNKSGTNSKTKGGIQ